MTGNALKSFVGPPGNSTAVERVRACTITNVTEKLTPYIAKSIRVSNRFERFDTFKGINLKEPILQKN